MKTKSSFKNSIASIVTNLVTILIGLISQAIFIKILDVEYLGLNGLFSNIISMIGIVELGIGSAIVYNLYKPMESNDKETIKSLMNFYKKAYNIIAVIVLAFGLAITPFLNFFIGEITVKINIIIVYILFVADIVCSYLFSYKRSILYADQKNYIINIIHMFYLVFLNILQLLFLYLTKNYYVFLLIKIVMRIFENIVITILVDKKYNYLKESAEQLDYLIEKDIFKKVKALFYHKIGTFIVLGTDNIIISKYLGLIAVGLYSNYYMIINAVNVLFGQAITALTPSIGYMLITDSKKKSYNIFSKVRFMNFWISTFAGISILLIMQPFIKIWVGEKFLLKNSVLIVLVLNFYQKMMRNSYNTFKEAAGIYHEDRYVPLVESILNILFSIIFVKLFGLVGVFMGTIISGLVLWCYSYPKYVYKNLFNRNYSSYVKETIGYIIVFIIITTITCFISMFCVVKSSFLQVIINMIICLIIPNITMVLLFRKTDNFKYFKELLNKII